MDATPPADSPPEPNPFEPPRAAGARPRPSTYRSLSVLGTFLGVVAVLLAGIVAFLVTCFPLGFMALGSGSQGAALFWLAWVVGAAVAMFVGFGTFRLVFRSRWRRLPPDEGRGP